MLLNPSCWLPGENSYSVSSPLKPLKESANILQIEEKEPVSYTFCSSMLEDWYLMKPLPSTVGIIYPKSKMSQQKHVQQEWMAKLREHYKAQTEAKEKDLTGCRILTDSEMVESAAPLNKYRSPLELKEDFLESINKLTYSDLTTAQINNLICSMNSFYSSIKWDHLNSDLSMSVYVEKLKELQCFHLITDIKQLTEKSEQTNLAVMQVMLIVKFVECHFDEKKLVDVVSDITSHLRFISLTAGHSAMINFLDKVLVDKFFDVCGKVLYEVYNELMLPIPDLLQAYSREEEDTTHSDSVLFSVNSFNSQASNLGSSKSCGVADAASRRQRFGTSSVSQLRRIIEIPSQTVSDGMKSEENEAKPRVRKASKSKNKGIIRDLFSAQDKPHSEKAIFESPDSKRQRNIYVSETPKVKQHMTAFTRQSLRMQKQHLRDDSMRGITFIEESPAKEGEVLNDFKSSKLTRRHSFYCDGKDSRSITRAKSLQQHQQGVLATPVVKVTGVTKGTSPKFGRRSLSSLFRSPIKENPNENHACSRAVTIHAQNSPSPAKSWQKNRSETYHSPLKMALRGQSVNMEQSSSENQPTSPDLIIHVENSPSPAKSWQKNQSETFHSPLKMALRRYQNVNMEQSSSENQPTSPDLIIHAKNSPSRVDNIEKSQCQSFHSPLKMALRGYQALKVEKTSGDNPSARPDYTFLTGNSPSPAKILQKSFSEPSHSPLKMALRGYHAATSSENVNFGSSPEVCPKSLCDLFHSPLISNQSRNIEERNSVDEKTQKGMTDKSDSANISVTAHLQGTATLKGRGRRRNTSNFEHNASTQSGLSFPNEHDGHGTLNSPTDSDSNSSPSKAKNRRQLWGRTTRRQKRRKSSSTSG